MLTFVLSGGGSRGAFQAGALKALLEAGIIPQMLVGTSAGALNATYLAIHGLGVSEAEALCETWRIVADQDFLSSGRTWLTARALLNRPDRRFFERMRQFLLDEGLSPQLRFGQLENVRLIVIATDLIRQCCVLYGESPYDSVLEAVLASTAVPPWIPPLESDGRLLVDGGFVSYLPIEPAIRSGATDIIALDVTASGDAETEEINGIGAIVSRVVATTVARQRYLEQALAEAHGIPIHRITIQNEEKVPLWDFSQTPRLIEEGYVAARRFANTWRHNETLALRWQKWQKRFIQYLNEGGDV